jgi:hypothetical protein
MLLVCLISLLFSAGGGALGHPVEYIQLNKAFRSDGKPLFEQIQ